MQHLEDQEQARFCAWLDEHGILYHANPNGGYRTPAQAAMFKRTGVKAGVPDIFICEPRGYQHGMYVEMKRVGGGVVSDAQRGWIMKLKQRGYNVRVCHGAEAAIRAVEEYFGNEDRLY